MLTATTTTKTQLYRITRRWYSISVAQQRRKHPNRGGQNLSERYARLENSVRGKESQTSKLDDLKAREAEPIGLLNRRLVKKETLFHGLVIPEEPISPKDDECCMSGCAVCVYDLYEESLATYKTAVSKIHQTLVELKVPETEWPAQIRVKSGNTAPAPPKSVALSAFEALEQALKEKQAASNKPTPVVSDTHLPPRNRPKQTWDLREVYEGLRWVLFIKH